LETKQRAIIYARAEHCAHSLASKNLEISSWTEDRTGTQLHGVSVGSGEQLDIIMQDWGRFTVN
jgi:hypothetical protein